MQLAIRQVISTRFKTTEDYEDWLAGQERGAVNSGFKFAYLNGDNKAVAFFVPRPLDKARDEGSLTRSQSFAWISSDPQEFGVVYKTLTMRSIDDAQEAAKIAVGQSIEFKVIPMPSDQYEFLVKPEAVRHFDHLIAK